MLTYTAGSDTTAVIGQPDFGSPALNSLVWLGTAIVCMCLARERFRISMQGFTQVGLLGPCSRLLLPGRLGAEQCGRAFQRCGAASAASQPRRRDRGHADGIKGAFTCYSRGRRLTFYFRMKGCN